MLFESLDKLKRNSILSAILLTPLGAIILILPERLVPMLILVLGYVLVVLALVMMLGFLSSKKSLMDYIKFVAALAIFIVSICVLVYRSDIVPVVVACVLFIGSCLLCLVDLEPKTPTGMPLLAVCGIVFSIALAIYSIGKLSSK